MAKEWELIDAKPGDVIQSGQITILFKEFADPEWNFVIAYAGIDVSGSLQITDGHWLISNDSRLATEEESNKLFGLLKENGYHWDKDECRLYK